MSFKTSRLYLYSSDLLSELGMLIEATDALSSITAPNPLELDGTTIDLKCGSTQYAQVTSDKFIFDNYLAASSASVSAPGGAGTRLKLSNDVLSASNYSLGVNTSELWYNCPSAGAHKFHVQASPILEVDSTGVSITGDLNFTGSITTSATPEFDDQVLVVHYDLPSGATTQGAFNTAVDGSGLRVGNTTQSGAGITNPTFLYDSATDSWVSNIGISASSVAVTGTLECSTIDSAGAGNITFKRDGTSMMELTSYGILSDQQVSLSYQNTIKGLNASGCQFYVGTGNTTAPYYNGFDYNTGNTTDDTYVIAYHDQYQAGVVIQGSRGSPASNDCAAITFTNYGSGSNYLQAEIATRSSGNANQDGILYIRTSSDGSTLTEAFRCDQNQNCHCAGDLTMSAGDVVASTINSATGVNLQYNESTKLATTSTGATVTGVLDVETINNSSGVALQYGGSTKLETTSAGVTVTGVVTETSDRRLKENIERVDMDEMLRWVEEVELVKYSLKDTPDVRSIGVIAQQLQTIAPDLVHEGADGTLSVDYRSLDVAALAVLQTLIKKQDVVV